MLKPSQVAPVLMRETCTVYYVTSRVYTTYIVALDIDAARMYISISDALLLHRLHGLSSKLHALCTSWLYGATSYRTSFYNQLSSELWHKVVATTKMFLGDLCARAATLNGQSARALNSLQRRVSDALQIQ